MFLNPVFWQSKSKIIKPKIKKGYSGQIGLDSRAYNFYPVWTLEKLKNLCY